MENMSLYKINEEIENLIISAADPETGEINESVYAALDELNIAREQKIENIALFIKNQQALAESLKKEKMSFAARQKSAEGRVARMTSYLESCLNGEKVTSSKFEIKYTKSTACVIDDEAKCIRWLKRHDGKEAVQTVVTVAKDFVKKLLKSEVEVPGAHLEQRTNMSVK